MRASKPFIIIALGAFTIGGLAACTPSPKPDEVLVSMYQDALFDAQALAQSAPDVSALRQDHATEINAEIQRLCGFTDDGALPESCTFEIPTIGAAPDGNPDYRIGDSQVRILNKLSEVPQESIPLITEHYIEQAQLGPVVSGIDVLNGVTLSGADLATAQDLLAGEYAAAWALGVALPHVSPDLTSATQSAIDRHREYAALLRTTIDPFAETSPSEPGYDLSHLTEAVDPASAAIMATEVQSHSLAEWHHAAGTATDPGWRSLATQIAGAIARDSASFN